MTTVVLRLAEVALGILLVAIVTGTAWGLAQPLADAWDRVRRSIQQARRW